MIRSKKQYKYLKIIKPKNGFTLVEIIVVLFVISLGLVGVLTLIVQNIQSQSYNKNNLIAYQLAQEGIELIRKVRDSNWKASQPFNTNLADGEYYMDYRDATPHDALPDPALIILKQDADGFYLHNFNGPEPDSGFSRRLTLQNIDNYSFRVTAQISWGGHGRNYTYYLETILYDWR